jgi:hypothetical protein
MRTITVEIKTIDGDDLILPVCADAKHFARMLGTRELTFEALISIRALRYNIKFLSDESSRWRIALAAAAS